MTAFVPCPTAPTPLGSSEPIEDGRSAGVGDVSVRTLVVVVVVMVVADVVEVMIVVVHLPNLRRGRRGLVVVITVVVIVVVVRGGGGGRGGPHIVSPLLEASNKKTSLFGQFEQYVTIA